MLRYESSSYLKILMSDVMYDFEKQHLICEIWKYQSESIHISCKKITEWQTSNIPGFSSFYVMF